VTAVAATLARWRVTLGFVTGAAVLLLARPTWTSWGLGLTIAAAGEGLRIWAAGHLEKSREVTRSGPYRWMRHPLYVGSAIMALGVVVAGRSVAAGALVMLYMGATLLAAVRTEEAFLSRAFGDTYDRYRAARADPMARPFSLERARRNREHRAVAGLVIGFAVLALKVRLNL
jgi:protein-S-isoprenylcysteine O-methyltransferase Ste14